MLSCAPCSAVFNFSNHFFFVCVCFVCAKDYVAPRIANPGVIRFVLVLVLSIVIYTRYSLFGKGMRRKQSRSRGLHCLVGAFSARGASE